MLEVHRNAMLQIGRPTIMGEGVKVLCEPHEVNDILFAIHTDGVTFADSVHFELDDLRASHVILSASLEPLVMAAIAAEPGTGLTGGKSRDKVTVSRRADFEVKGGIAAPWRCSRKTPRIVPAHMIISTSSCGRVCISVCVRVCTLKCMSASMSERVCTHFRVRMVALHLCGYP